MLFHHTVKIFTTKDTEKFTQRFTKISFSIKLGTLALKIAFWPVRKVLTICKFSTFIVNPDIPVRLARNRYSWLNLFFPMAILG